MSLKKRTSCYLSYSIEFSEEDPQIPNKFTWRNLQYIAIVKNSHHGNTLQMHFKLYRKCWNWNRKLPFVSHACVFNNMTTEVEQKKWYLQILRGQTISNLLIKSVFKSICIMDTKDRKRNYENLRNVEIKSANRLNENLWIVEIFRVKSIPVFCVCVSESLTFLRLFFKPLLQHHDRWFLYIVFCFIFILFPTVSRNHG